MPRSGNNRRPGARQQADGDGDGAGRGAGIERAVGRAITEIRIERGMKQLELAEASDLEAAQLSHIVNGRGNPAWGTLSRISAALGVALSKLLARAEELEAGEERRRQRA